MKHAKKTDKKDKQKKTLNILLILLAITLVALAVTIYRDYQARPGFLEKIWIADRGADYITVAWEKPRNVYKYVVTYNDKTISVSGMRSEIRLTELSEGTNYKISVRADSREREGFEALTENTMTKRRQTIEGAESQMKFANIPVDLKQEALTNITYYSESTNMKVMDDKLMFTKPGKYVVTAKAEATEDYVSASKKINVEVLDTVNISPKKATPHTFYKLNKKNCELVMTITGVKEGKTPQSFVYVDGKYVVMFSVTGNSTQRIITFGDKKTVIKPKIDMRHGNGATFANGRYYVAKGASTECVSFNESFDDFQLINLPYKASGIAYDEKTNMFFVSQHNRLLTYDTDFNNVSRFARIKRSAKHYAQDCGAYGGIMMHCVSGSDFQGINYIDFYDMLNKKYLGTVECNLNEVESLLVDDEGYIELLCNTPKLEDYIWKTPINMHMLCD